MPEQAERHAQQVMACLEKNPHSADTLEGIMRWWICNPEKNIVSVRQALEQLTREGKRGKVGNAYAFRWKHRLFPGLSIM